MKNMKLKDIYELIEQSFVLPEGWDAHYSHHADDTTEAWSVVDRDGEYIFSVLWDPAEEVVS